MRHFASAVFWTRYQALPTEIRQRADKQFVLLKQNPGHPSLQFKKIGERRRQEVWSARVNLHYRALAIRREDRYLWFWIGNHKDYDLLVSAYSEPAANETLWEMRRSALMAIF